MKWRTRLGELIDVNDMDYNHVRNAKRMLEREVSEVESILCQVDEETIGSFAVSQASEWIARADKYIKAFDKRLSTLTSEV